MENESVPVSGAPTRRRPRAAVRIALAAFAVLSGLVAVEAAVRIRHYLKTGSFAEVYRFDVDAATGLRLPRPGRNGNLTVNARGFRGPEIEDPKPAGRLRLGFLGGSTTFCAETSGDEATWPHLVTAGLRAAFPGQSFDYVNASAAGFATDASLTNLRHRLAPLDPDVVVIYHATNDLAKDSRAEAEAHGLWTAPRESALGHWWMTWSLIEKNLLLRAGAPPAAGRLRADFDALAGRFAGRLEALVRAAQETAEVVVVVTFSHRVRAGQDPAEQAAAAQSALYYMPFFGPQDLVDGVAAYNRAIAAVAARTGAVLIGDEDRIPADGVHFNDSVHLLDAGCRVMAERIVDGLRAAGPFRALVGQ